MAKEYPSSRNPIDLDYNARIKFDKFSALMRANNIGFIVTCTYRNNTEQARLYAQGRTAPGPVVTHAKAGQSKHNAVDSTGHPASKAFDIVILKNGKPDWDVKNPDWATAGKLGVQCGLDWAGNWKTFKEFPHFEIKE